MQASLKINGNNGTVCVNAPIVIQFINKDLRKKIINEDILLPLFQL